VQRDPGLEPGPFAFVERARGDLDAQMIGQCDDGAEVEAEAPVGLVVGRGRYMRADDFRREEFARAALNFQPVERVGAIGSPEAMRAGEDSIVGARIGACASRPSMPEGFATPRRRSALSAARPD
jgi:hypothetical protein